MNNNEKIPDQTMSLIDRHLQTLKLYRIQEALDRELSLAAQNNTSFPIILERLLATEAVAFVERRIGSRIKASKLPERKLLADFDFNFQPGIDQKQIMDLATLSFVDRHQGLILAGNSGVGNYAKFLLM